jgi:uncharacterized membrane protein
MKNNELRQQQASGAVLWERPGLVRTRRVVQVVLAVCFVYGGLIKLVPPDALPGAALIDRLLSPLPKALVYLTGVTEMLGGLGLLLPMSLRILPMLTPLAAIGLIMEMVGALVFILIYYNPLFAASTVLTGLLLAWVGYGCWVQIKQNAFVGRTRSSQELRHEIETR